MMPGRLATALALAGLLAGCEGSRVVRVASPAGAGGSWATVLPGPLVSDSDAEQVPLRWADERNNDELNNRRIDPVLATNEWPARERPSLRKPVYVRIYRQPEAFIYYRTDRYDRYWRHYR